MAEEVGSRVQIQELTERETLFLRGIVAQARGNYQEQNHIFFGSASSIQVIEITQNKIAYRLFLTSSFSYNFGSEIIPKHIHYNRMGMEYVAAFGTNRLDNLADVIFPQEHDQQMVISLSEGEVLEIPREILHSIKANSGTTVVLWGDFERSHWEEFE